MTAFLPDLPGAVCASVGDDLWFPEVNDRTTAAKARDICAGCPERLPCAEYAVADASLLGVWGGLTTRERMDLRSAGGDRASTARAALSARRLARIRDAHTYAARGGPTPDIATRLGVTARAVERYLKESA